MNDKAVVLLSGGLDSTTCATLACKEYGAQNVIALSIGYGQKHKAELDNAKAVVSFLGISKHIIQELPPIFAGSGCTLIESENLNNPNASYEDLQKNNVIVPTYVPFRNGILLSIATALALVEQAQSVVCGVHAGDSKNWIYADCSFEFLGGMANAIFAGTYMKVRLHTPLQYMTKAEVVNKGLEVNAPFHLTRSCYNGTKLSCGTCSTCIDRLNAFKIAGVEDPILYEVQEVK